MINADCLTHLEHINTWNQKQLTSLENIPSPIYSGPSTHPMISIMINVAWGNEYLLDLLAVLNNHNVKATFFLDGSWVNKYPLLGKKILDEGHDIGNHAYSHPDMRGLTLERIQWELQKTNEVIEKVLGVKPKLFTPPSGELDERVTYLASKEGMLTVLSTIDTLDWKKPSPKDLIHSVESNLKNGAMILMHPTESILLSLSDLIQTIKNSHYTLVPIRKLLAQELQTEKIHLMSLEETTLYVDGQPITTPYMIKNNHFMVPALFFKQLGLGVDLDFQNSQIIFSTTKKNNTLYMYDDFPYVSLCNVCHQFDINIFHDPATLRIYLITKDSPISDTKILFRANSLQKQVALTFDDGPDDYITPKILDILKDKGVKATFFVLGEQVSIFPEILKRIVSEGHAIGNHTWSHHNLLTLSTSEVIRQLEATQEIIHSITGLTPSIFRPPFGASTLADYYTILNLGFQIINWNIDTLDYEGRTVHQIIDTIEKELSPGSIILQHSFQDTNGLLEGGITALPIIIDKLKATHIELVTIEDLIS